MKQIAGMTADGPAERKHEPISPEKIHDDIVLLQSLCEQPLIGYAVTPIGGK